MPLLVPVRHKPVLGSLHLGVVMACTTSTTSCQGCTETNFSGMDAIVERCQKGLTKLLDSEELEDDAGPGGRRHFGSSAPG